MAMSTTDSALPLVLSPARTLEVRGAEPFQYSTETVPSRWFACKGILDRVIAAMLLVPGLPIIAVLVAIVRLTSKGPGIYSQTRVGRRGMSYRMYKIRTMRQDAEKATGPVWTSENDPRITRIGRILRKLHLDEFPQLVNVVRGEMSLIGPRPERPEFVELLAKEIPGYCDRLLVLPGITGLAQINLPPDTDFDSVRRKLILDVQYIQQATIGMDARMFLCTFLRLLGLQGDRAMCIMGLKRDVVLPLSQELDDCPIGSSNSDVQSVCAQVEQV
jgi:lipopolysaccharide/colanic/teichoic acid biosynthesis glycosyltransferase